MLKASDGVPLKKYFSSKKIKLMLCKLDKGVVSV